MGHLVDTSGMFLGFIGQDAPGGPSVDDDPLGAFTAARDAIQAALDDPATAAQEYDGMFGRTTFAESVDGFLSADLVIHRWDLARATGQDETLPDDEVRPRPRDARARWTRRCAGRERSDRRWSRRRAPTPRPSCSASSVVTSDRATAVRTVSGSDRHASATDPPRWRHERPGRHHHRHLLRAVVLGAARCRRTSCRTGRPPRRRPPASGPACGAGPTGRRPESVTGPELVCRAVHLITEGALDGRPEADLARRSACRSATSAGCSSSTWAPRPTSWRGATAPTSPAGSWRTPTCR